MTIKELYLLAKAKGLEDAEVEINYRDDGGYYPGSEALEEDMIEFEKSKNQIYL